jgi:hypothetical protein
MFTTYPEGSPHRVVVRNFDDAYVCAAWQATMKTFKALGVIEKCDVFPVNAFPANTVITK